ncbi:hypothetical protein FisN_15Hh139 [Fistulifera solaris]|uniref:Ubiquitin-like domain-containing protein n=1 Tax=Fistulifera solaris TaxID=1519565 RepID=A0A1Z5K9T9_FISSO|nr:hypothetical protein FisN_15Hh139 [Fistulifera solaris]|eukprot:GAX22966.1 hypothetical protein FisN_15Hh139 [Fistulifera solaris]
MKLAFSSLLSLLVLFGVEASIDVQVTVRGKKYDISGVTTVKDLQEQLKESGVEPSQHTILFGGKRLEDDDVLSDAGVEDGAQLSVIPRISKPKAKKTKTAAAPTTSASPQMNADTQSMMEQYMKNSGIDTSKLDEMMKSMGGGDGMPDMQESLKQMSSMMNSPVFQDFMNDPENLEKSRQMILNNPMLKGMMSGMPGMDELLNDPVAWREAMMAAANMYKNMDPEDLMKAMGGGQPGGLFDGTLDPSSLAAAKALDELDEDDD